MNTRLSAWRLILILAVLITACKDNEEEDDIKEFDRSTMLVNFEANIITPRYNDYQDKVATLKTSLESFEAAPDANNLSAFKQSFETAYLAWQNVATFELGPAMDIALKGFTNTYPTDTVLIEDNITTGGYNLGTAGNTDATGFPALDYLLFNGSEVEVLNAFTTDANASERMQYAKDIVTKMKNDIDYVVDQWANGYKTTFVESTGNDVGSSTGLLVNEMNKDFELIKNAEVGIPLGKKTLDVTRPTFVQGYYSGLSNQLTEVHLNSIFNFYKGVHFNSSTDDVGFDDYCNDLELNASNGNALDATIKERFGAIFTKLNAVSMTFSQAVDQETTAMNELYSEIQQTVVYLKTDLPSGIGVQITYQDNDGD